MKNDDNHLLHTEPANIAGKVELKKKHLRIFGKFFLHFTIRRHVTNYFLTKKIMILENTSLLTDFFRQFNSRLNCFDFIMKTRQLNNDYDPYKKEMLVLPVADAVVFKQLVDGNYSDFIDKVVRNIRIEPCCEAIYNSEIEFQIMLSYKQFLEKERCNFTIEKDFENNRFLLIINDLMSDLILNPISQVHTEVVESYKNFNQLIEAVGGDPKRLFLNANLPTAFSYFIQIWVSENLGIPLNLQQNFVVV